MSIKPTGDRILVERLAGPEIEQPPVIHTVERPLANQWLVLDVGPKVTEVEPTDVVALQGEFSGEEFYHSGRALRIVRLAEVVALV